MAKVLKFCMNCQSTQEISIKIGYNKQLSFHLQFARRG